MLYKSREQIEYETIFKQFQTRKKEIQDLIIDKLFIYLRDGILPQYNTNTMMDLYNIIYGYSDKGIGGALLDYHNTIIRKATEECCEKIQYLNGLEFIESFITYTERLNYIILQMARIFQYISSNYLKTTGSKDNKRIYYEEDISEFSMDIYKINFFDKLDIKLFKIINDFLIRDERNDDMDYKTKIEAFMKILNYMDFMKPKIVKFNNSSAIWVETSELQTNNEFKYQKKWLTFFKEETRNIYIKTFENKIEKTVKDNTIKDNIKNEIKKLNEELEYEIKIDTNFLNIDINHILYERVVKKFIEPIVNMKNLLEKNKIEEFGEMYQLFCIHSEGKILFAKKLSDYLKERYSDFFKNEKILKDSRKFIFELLKIKKGINDLFFSKEEFKNLENVAFSILIKKDIYPKHLANYVDFNMRNGFKGKQEKEIEQELNDIISIFKNINSKHVFQIESEKKLSNRLIKGLSLSINTEKLLISKLKEEYGITYVKKMSEMINDLEKNKSEIEEYKNTSSKGIPNGIKFNIQIVSNEWKLNQLYSQKIEIPPFLQFCIDDFKNYYINKYQDKKLIWCLGLSKLEIQYLYLEPKKISISTLPQLLTLLYLEKYEKLTLEKISGLLGCNIKIILNDISGLVFNPSFNPKREVNNGVILADIDPETKEFQNTTEISINKGFLITQLRFNTLPLSNKKTEDEIKETNAEEAKIIKIYENNIIQATLTRIMKGRIGKETTHVWLVNETAKQINLFNAEPQQIKENIEKLIEKNIIKRNHSSYEYIA